MALNNKIVHKTYRLEGRTPFERVHGITPDISPFMDFAFYDKCFYIIDKPGKFPLPKRRVGRWLGPAKQITSDLVYKVLDKRGLVVITSSVYPILQVDLDSPGILDNIKEYDEEIGRLIPKGEIVPFQLEDVASPGPAPIPTGGRKKTKDNLQVQSHSVSQVRTDKKKSNDISQMRSHAVSQVRTDKFRSISGDEIVGDGAQTVQHDWPSVDGQG